MTVTTDTVQNGLNPIPESNNSSQIEVSRLRLNSIVSRRSSIIRMNSDENSPTRIRRGSTRRGSIY
jgi:hypothetical protein